MASPPPDNRLDSQPAIESPLRQMSFPASEIEPKNAPASPLRHVRSRSHGNHGDNDIIHVDNPKHPLHHPDGFAATPAQDEPTVAIEERFEEDQPILAADEARPGSAYLHPAVSPTRGSFDEEYRSRTPSVSHSRSNSRSASAQGVPNLTRFDSREMHDDNHTPLENVEEYEPLFPDDENKKERPVSVADRFKQRPELSKHRFPSQDIWEDAPNSLQLHATVTTPDLPRPDSSGIFETPEQEAMRRMQNSKIDSHQVASHILEGENARESPKAPKRPNAIKQRFPSQDIWEDVPDSQQLVTTVGPAEDGVKSPEVPARPSIPIRPQKQPQNTSPIEKRQPPVIPGRPKPQVPVRPAKANPQAPAGSETKEASLEGSAVPKAKPAVPARPGGSKIAALKAGFLTDLNSRLQLGPQQPKPQEKEPEPLAEKQPLSDARKGRARGPARRKPAAENANARLPTIPEIRITETWNVWQLCEDGNLLVGDEKKVTKAPEISIPAEPTMAPEIAKNIAGEPVDPTLEPPAAIEETASNYNGATPEVEQTLTEDVAPEQIPEPIVEPPTQSDEPQSDPKEYEPLTETTQALVEEAPSPKLENALEDMTASADGKKASDGDIHGVASSY